MNLRGIPGFGRRPPHASHANPLDGTRVERRIAALTDPAVLERAHKSAHAVAFFALEGPLEEGERASQAIAAIAEAVFGVDKGSTRVSLDAAGLSFAFDPARATLEAIQRILDRKLARMRLTALPMRIID